VLAQTADVKASASPTHMLLDCTSYADCLEIKSKIISVNENTIAISSIFSIRSPKIRKARRLTQNGVVL
jgi:hypothetical protein